ncbi:hypothetical protein NQ318_016318 [Aromia moschata]|uniref:Uncharacterized protein n=1 Tax=Aromia moschata TaxID=1265417 RepID=A0AAV8Z3C4_9CUCU|nr:hypothetical protein NQ318_016318 [Aromia moschata]
MDLDEIKVVYTCGLCEVIVDEIIDHPCIEGYGHIYIDNNHHFYPVLELQEIIYSPTKSTYYGTMSISPPSRHNQVLIKAKSVVRKPQRSVIQRETVVPPPSPAILSCRQKP